jgi:intein/homing endonuclease
MADGSQKPIQDIRPGDFVWNPRTRAPQAVARVIAGPEEKPLYEVGVVGSELLVTEDHPFLTPFGLIQARDLKIGMHLLIGEQETRVVKVQEKPVTDSAPIVWNLELAVSEREDDHFVWAAGIMTGDLYLQNSLKREKKAVP